LAGPPLGPEVSGQGLDGGGGPVELGGDVGLRPPLDEEGAEDLIAAV
jgi:hypothetical protein